jgi:hypothetical protein
MGNDLGTDFGHGGPRSADRWSLQWTGVCSLRLDRTSATDQTCRFFDPTVRWKGAADAAQALNSALQAGDQGSRDETSDLTPQEELRLLHIME